MTSPVLAEVEREIAEASAIADRLTPAPTPMVFPTYPSETVVYPTTYWDFYIARWLAVFEAALKEIQRARAARP